MHALPYWRLSGYYFFYFAFIGAFSPYFGLYLQSLSFSAWDIGLLMSQMQLMRLFGPNAWGWAVDRFGHRLAIIRLAGAIGLAGFLAFYWLDKLPGMLLAMAVLAFFWSAALPLVEALTFDHLHEEPARYSKLRVWGSIGFIVAVMATGAVLDWVQPVGVLWVCTLILSGILACAMVLPEAPHIQHHESAPAIGEILKDGPVRGFLVACFAMSVAHGAYYVFYSIHLADHGYSKTSVGLLWSLGVLAEIFVFMAMPKLSRRITLRHIMLFCFATAVLRFVLIGWGVESLAVMIFAQLLHAFTFGAYHASAIAAVSQWFPGKAQARGQALYSSLTFGAGGLLGALISGRTWDAWGAGWTFSLGAAFALLGLYCIWRWLHEPAAVHGPKWQKTDDPVQ